MRATAVISLLTVVATFGAAMAQGGDRAARQERRRRARGDAADTAMRDFATVDAALSSGGDGAAAALPCGCPPGSDCDLSLDWDEDGLPNVCDGCPSVLFEPGFDWRACAPMDRNPDNDRDPECKARERVLNQLLNRSAFSTHIAFAVVIRDRVHFADAFTYVGQGQYEHDPDGIHRLFRIGSTSKSVTAVAATVLEEEGRLSFDDYVNDDDATRLEFGQVTLRQLMSHRDAFKVDNGAIHLFCYPRDLTAFWLEPDDRVSPHYDSQPYGNLGGGYNYSAFNYSLAGAYLVTQSRQSFARIVQTRVFDPAGMCTATIDHRRAASVPNGWPAAVAQGPSMIVGPYINLVSQQDERCEDNFYSSEDLPGDPFDWQYYNLDEAAAEPRDPAGGVIASVIDLGHFAASLLDSYHDRGGLISPAGVRRLWERTTDLGCRPNCPYDDYYGIGFFTNALPGRPVTQAAHGGSRPGHASAFVLRPEADLAVSILVNADVSTVTLSNLAKTILDELESP